MMIKLKIKYDKFEPGKGYSGAYPSYLINDQGSKFVLVFRFGKVEKKQYGPAAFGMNGQKYTKMTELVNDTLQIIKKKTDISAETKKVLIHVTKISAGLEKYQPSIFDLVDDKTLANVRNDFGEIAAAIDSLRQGKKYIQFSSAINEATYDYMEDGIGIAVKSGKSESNFGSGNSITNLKNELEKYKPINATEKILHEGFTLMANRLPFQSISFFCQHLPYLSKLETHVKKTQKLTISNHTQLKQFVDQMANSGITNKQFYELVPPTKYGLAINKLNQEADINSVMFFLLTNMAADLNIKLAKEIDIFAKKIFAMKSGAVKIVTLTRQKGISFSSGDYEKFNIKWHYWANAAKALNNWPGFKVVKKS